MLDNLCNIKNIKILFLLLWRAALQEQPQEPQNRPYSL